MPKVSVIMPSLNVADYMQECLASVISQTFKDLEIICVDAGSTDGTREIIASFAENDSRITVIDSPKKSYGHQMNLGLDAATGDYIGIVETDDFCDSTMFEALFTAIEHYGADAIKGNYYSHRSFPASSDVLTSNLASCPLNTPFKPAEHQEIFFAAPAIWSGLYRRTFLRENGIRFTETPGASFQDTAFNFKVWACADVAVALPEAYLHYRIDNEGSSVKSRAKVDFVNYEFSEIERFLEERPGLPDQLVYTKNALKFATYQWNTGRLSYDMRHGYFQSVVEEFGQARERGELKREAFGAEKWDELQHMLANPDDYFIQTYGPFATQCSIFLDLGEDQTQLERTIACLRGQTHADFEVYGMSEAWNARMKDAALALCQDDPRFRVLGPSDYLGDALDVSAAHSDTVVFMCAGQVLAEDALEKMVTNVSGDDGEVWYESPSSPGNDLVSFLRSYYQQPTELPLMYGSKAAFGDLPISPYALKVLAPLYCGASARTSSGLCVGWPSASPGKRPYCAMSLYRQHVDDILAVQAHCSSVKTSEDLRAAFLRHGYARVSWLEYVYKRMPDAYAQKLSVKYRPQNYLNKVISCSVPKGHASACAVSVVVPLHNNAYSVASCLGSLQAQRLTDLEVIFVDDGSTDDTVARVRAAQKNDARIVLMEKSAGGTSCARNSALEVAVGTYVLFLNPDDALPTNTALESMVAAAKEQGGALVCGYDGKDVSVFPTKSWAKDLELSHYLFKRSFVEYADLRFPSLTACDDVVFVASALMATERVVLAPADGYAQDVRTEVEHDLADYEACDVVRGVNAILRASCEAGYAQLHARALALLESDYHASLVNNLACEALLPLLVEANSLVSIDLLRKANVFVDDGYTIKPLAAYATRMRNVQDELGKTRKQLAKMKASAGLKAVPYHARKIVGSVRSEGLLASLSKGTKKVRKSLGK